MYDGPFGIVPSDGELVPRWTHPVPNGVYRVDFIDSSTLTGCVVPARMQAKIHKIHTMEHPDETELDMSEGEEEFTSTSGRTIVTPRRGRIRDRSTDADTLAENVLDLSQDQISEVRESINSMADGFRSHFLETLIPTLLGFDIAAGETEAIARDILDTDVEIDSETVDYMERVGIATMIGKQLRRHPDIFGDTVVDQVLITWLNESFAEVREARKKSSYVSPMRRLMSEFEGLIAKPKGSNIGVAKSRGQQQDPVSQNYYIDR